MRSRSNSRSPPQIMYDLELGHGITHSPSVSSSASPLLEHKSTTITPPLYEEQQSNKEAAINKYVVHVIVALFIVSVIISDALSPHRMYIGLHMICCYIFCVIAYELNAFIFRKVSTKIKFVSVSISRYSIPLIGILHCFQLLAFKLETIRICFGILSLLILIISIHWIAQKTFISVKAAIYLIINLILIVALFIYVSFIGLKIKIAIFIAINLFIYWLLYRQFGGFVCYLFKTLSSFIIIAICVYFSFMSTTPISVSALDVHKHNKADNLLLLPANYNMNAQKICQPNQEKIESNEFKYPFVLKPSECTTSSRGFGIIHDAEEFVKYIHQRDAKHTEYCSVMQSFANDGVEWCVFYYRYPYFSKGNLKSVGERNKNEKVQAIDSKYAHHDYKIGGYWTKHSDNEEQLIKDAVGLQKFMDDISNNYTNNGWFIGKVDLKTKNGEKDLISGENINVFEMSQSITTDMQDKHVAFFKGHYRMFSAQVYVGFVNLMMGNVNVGDLLQSPYYYVQRFFICNNDQNENYEHLWGVFR